MKRDSIAFKIFTKLYECYGDLNWWPAETRFEVIVGAILTQNTSWKNVEKAIHNLKAKGMLDRYRIKNISVGTLANLIKPSGYYNLKAQRLKNFIKFLFSRYEGSLSKMFKEELMVLRSSLLTVNGLGPETVDSILLYAGKKPIFVVDAYTKRIFSRHGLVKKEQGYHAVQKFFHDNLPHDVDLFNKYHALIVKIGKELCRKNPNCLQCPLKDITGLFIKGRDDAE